MMRLFVGIGLPEEITDELVMLCSGLPGARWIDADNMHITLRFIGEVDEGAAEDVDEMLAEVETDSFALELRGVGTFGKGAKTRSVWTGVEPLTAIVRLQAKVESAVVRAGQPPEGRKFTPHVTLARFNRIDPLRLQAYIQGNNLFRAGPFTIEHFTLFQSRTGKGGAVYTPLADYPLRG